MGTAVREIKNDVARVMGVYPNGLPMVVHLRPVIDVTEDELFRSCQLNRDLRIERAAQGGDHHAAGLDEALTKEERQKLAPTCPDFVIELRSGTDRLPAVQAKMREYMENGARLGFLIVPRTRRVHVHRPGRRPEILKNSGHRLGRDRPPRLPPRFARDLVVARPANSL
jgi:hypothetical protein